MANKKIFNCEFCGDIDHLLMDAGFIKEREFEGMFFNITYFDNGDITVTNNPEDDNYLSDFNMKKIFNDAKEMASEEDLSYFVCPMCYEYME